MYPHLPLVLAQNPYFYIVFWPEKTTWTPALTCDPHTGIHFFPPTTKNMAKPASNLVISPSDEDTLEDDEFANFLFTNEVTQVNEIDESSNSSTAEYTQLVSLSVTSKRKYYQTTSKHSHYVNI